MAPEGSKCVPICISSISSQWKQTTSLHLITQNKNKPCKAERLVRRQSTAQQHSPTVLCALGSTENMDRRASGAKYPSMSFLLPNLKNAKQGKAGGGIATGQGTVCPLKNHLIFKGRSIKKSPAHFAMSVPKGDRRKCHLRWLQVSTLWNQMKTKCGHKGQWLFMRGHFCPLPVQEEGVPFKVGEGGQQMGALASVLKGGQRLSKAVHQESRYEEKLWCLSCFLLVWSKFLTIAPLLLVTGLW